MLDFRIGSDGSTNFPVSVIKLNSSTNILHMLKLSLNLSEQQNEVMILTLKINYYIFIMICNPRIPVEVMSFFFLLLKMRVGFLLMLSQVNYIRIFIFINQFQKRCLKT